MTPLVLLMAGALLLLPHTSRVRVIRGRPLVAGLRIRILSRPAAQPDVAAVIAGMRDELLAGATLRSAFERAAGPEPTGRLAGPVATCRMGGDVPAALRRDCAGEPLMLSLAALWQVCEGSGAAVAAALDRLVETARSTARVRQEIAAQLAGPRATVRVLAVLPLIGVGMGLMMGADPLGFLFGTGWGWACLVLAAFLEAVGIAWMRRLVSGIESRL